MRLPLALCVLLVLAGCLTATSGCDASVDVEPYDGMIVVAARYGADSEPILVLVAEDDGGCNDPLRIGVEEARGARLHVRVEGIERPRGATCTAIIPASGRVALPFREQGSFPVLVTHAGETDEYRYSVGFAGVTFEAVRTSTTRLDE